MNKLFLSILIILIIGCQREKMNEAGVDYNKSLIVPPNNELPEPGTKIQDSLEEESSNDNTLVNSILDQTEANQANTSIIQKIDDESGYKTDENFFQWLFKGKSKR